MVTMAILHSIYQRVQLLLWLGAVTKDDADEEEEEGKEDEEEDATGLAKGRVFHDRVAACS